MISSAVFPLLIDGVKDKKRPTMVRMATRWSEHTTAALSWIKYAYQKTDHRGISKGFDLLRNQWAPAYPETTGYTIPTLLNAAQVFQQPLWQDIALRLADYLLQSATADGGVAHWRDSKQSKPIVFDTGQAIFGWLAAFEVSQDQRYLQASQKAGNWLVKIQDDDGAWRQGQHLSTTKVIDTRVAWALLRLFYHSQQEIHRQAAILNCEWALQNQTSDGWFKNCAFLPNHDPFTHTLAYTAEGLFECGSILNKPTYIEAASQTAKTLRDLQRSDGSLASTYGPGWLSTSASSCLTGNCQMARLWMQFSSRDQDSSYMEAAQNALEFVISIQDIKTKDTNRHGGILGSFPVWGKYERFKYPNWAAKFFVDAMLTWHAMQNKSTGYRLHYYG